jgi:hypothetical protein
MSIVLFFCMIVVALVWYIMSRPTGESEQQAAPELSNEELIANANMMMAKVEAMVQASEMGRDDVHQQLMDGTYDGPLPEKRSDGAWTSIFDDLRILSIAGINHRQGVIRYTGRNTVALVPEPKNEFDPNAIKVLAEDGHHLGYIQRHQTDMVRSWARNQFPFYCIARIEEHDDEDDGHRFYTGYLYIKKTAVSQS